MLSELVLTALPQIPLVQKGDDLTSTILRGLNEADLALQNGDILVLARKIVSKSEGRAVDLKDVVPSARAHEIAEITLKDPRLVELILSESTEVVRVTKGCKEENKEGQIIVRHRLGYVLADAGIAMSKDNGSQFNCKTESFDSSVRRESPLVLLLPANPDRTCERIRNALLKNRGAHVGIIIIDSHERSLRQGTIGIALGVAGVPQEVRGWPDLFNKKLTTREVGLFDKLSAAASVLSQSQEGRPIVHMRGLKYESRPAAVKTLV